MNLLTGHMFTTKAIEVAPHDHPFWYTSGLIGTYYINGHYLFGGKETADSLLETINKIAKGNLDILPLIYSKTVRQYKSEPIYRDIIDASVKLIKKHIDISQISYISGGERRDWFFHSIIGDILDKPVLYILKDLSVYSVTETTAKKVESIDGSKILHIADLITVASSYTRSWIPSIKRIGGNITHSVNIVDRLQGGGNILSENGISNFSLFRINKHLFETALSEGYITNEQFEMIVKYLDDPFVSMRSFLIKNPDYIKRSMASEDPRIANRAKLCMENNLYNLN